jgi:pectate lyase
MSRPRHKATLVTLGFLGASAVVGSIAASGGGAALGASTSSRAAVTAKSAPVVHGYATVKGSTTGGAGGSTVNATSLSALTAAVKASATSTVRVSGNFTCGTDLVVSSNKTIVGVGSGSGLTGCGLKLKSVKNVIIQNLKISFVKASGGTGDSIHIEKSDHLWIDHNDLSSDTSHGTDYYDGQLDITHAADFITVSNNYIHDHIKCSLIGHSDKNAAEDTGKLHVTYDHNYFRNCDQRTPSIRFGTLHAYNNYFVNGTTGIHTRMNAQALVQNNAWSGVKTPIETTQDSKVDGYVNESGNVFGGGTNRITRTGSMTSVPYAYTLESASAVASTVPANAGTGKI